MYNESYKAAWTLIKSSPITCSWVDMVMVNHPPLSWVDLSIAVAYMPKYKPYMRTMFPGSLAMMTAPVLAEELINPRKLDDPCTEVYTRVADCENEFGAPSFIFKESVRTKVLLGVSILYAFAPETSVRVDKSDDSAANAYDAMSSLLKISALSMPVAPVSQSYADPKVNFDIHAIIMLILKLSLILQTGLHISYSYLPSRQAR